MASEPTADVTARYYETETDRVLAFEWGEARAAIVQNKVGYAMLAVKPEAEADELERYYGFEMALDHAAELLGVRPSDLPVPDEAADMGI